MESGNKFHLQSLLIPLVSKPSRLCSGPSGAGVGVSARQRKVLGSWERAHFFPSQPASGGGPHGPGQGFYSPGAAGCGTETPALAHLEGLLPGWADSRGERRAPQTSGDPGPSALRVSPGELELTAPLSFKLKDWREWGTDSGV